MLKSLGILLVAAFIVKMEVPALLKTKKKKELILFSVLLAIGVGLGIGKSIGMPIPNPMDFLTFIYKPLNNVITGELE